MDLIKTKTRGNIIVDDIKRGDMHYDSSMKSWVVVISPPKCTSHEVFGSYWKWTSKNMDTGRLVMYGASSKYPKRNPKLSDHMPSEKVYGCWPLILVWAICIIGLWYIFQDFAK